MECERLEDEETQKAFHNGMTDSVECFRKLLTDVEENEDVKGQAIGERVTKGWRKLLHTTVKTRNGKEQV